MELRPKLTNPAYLVYLVVLILSLLVLFIGQTFTGINDDNQLGLAFVHYVAACLALFCLFANREEGKDLFVIVCLMFFVSCYALNRFMNVFNSTTPWFAVYLIITSLSLLMFRYMHYLPGWARAATGFVAGLALLAYVYLAVYLFPLYPVSIPGLIALGLSIHTFVPAVLCYVTSRNLIRHRLWKTGIVGFAAGLLVVIVFSLTYNRHVNQLTRIYNRQQVRGDGRLPAWIEAAQQLDNGFVMERVLKTGIVYLEGEREFFSFRGLPSRNWGNSLEHDPLVTIASLVSPKAAALPEERIKILETMYDKRHEGEERLWSGHALYTSYVSTQVKIWPELHLAYTEKALTVTNTERWGNQEAIYTFQLPEGGVVTSLSLWINGKEEKAILTTREKADTAYRTIVGVERRDPSVVRWQEGNRVSVRVFPVGANDTRMFRIGVTAPLSAVNDRLQYDNITFQGPPNRFTTEDISIALEGNADGFTPPPGFRRAGNAWEREGRYDAHWHLQLDSSPIIPNTFTFNGRSFSIEPYKLQRSPVQTDVIYLDVNSAWSHAEFSEAVRLAGTRAVKVPLGGQLLNVTAKNKDELFEELHSQRFSLFPLQNITDPEHALLITKNPPASPSLRDLEGSLFREELAAYLANNALPKIRLMNLGGNTLSPYLRALKESRVFRYEQGGLLQLNVLLTTNTFAGDTETENRVVIDQAQAAIVQTYDSAVVVQEAAAAIRDTVTTAAPPAAPAPGKKDTPGVTAGKPLSNAPDHLMRIFAYNHILRETGKGLITASEGQEKLVDVAREAYVVSPLSSLVVLETQHDYDRFGIKDEGESLKNASLQSKGAVPEPHEWALIVIALLSLTWLIYQRKWKPANV
ncbi:XrtN system VIT domain-containing protein [Chitinophaga barathri]|uniref:XrtN system VIT domain-containing protein n=1 Tax=Chitinophaga barathri TaxID=1647451 RepID=A0A3N4M8E6_9BACT|nr:XrtN system VIT domain-containing protein [Chitinophaga barathri]RPD39648.1 XrtN system VIT domain-containing protein [Chitinophaga barathri]